MCISYRVGCPHSPLPTYGSGGSGIGSIRRNGSASSQAGRSCKGWPSTHMTQEAVYISYVVIQFIHIFIQNSLYLM